MVLLKLKALPLLLWTMNSTTSFGNGPAGWGLGGAESTSHPTKIEGCLLYELPTAVVSDPGIRACPRSGSDWLCIVGPTDPRAVGAEARRHAQSSLLDTG